LTSVLEKDPRHACGGFDESGGFARAHRLVARAIESHRKCGSLRCSHGLEKNVRGRVVEREAAAVVKC
jgi:hypothetical protein